MNNKHKDISESKPDVNRPCPTGTPAGKSRVAFVTFGCRLNKAEALDLESTYAASGWEIVTLKHGNHGITGNEAKLRTSAVADFNPREQSHSMSETGHISHESHLAPHETATSTPQSSTGCKSCGGKEYPVATEQQLAPDLIIVRGCSVTARAQRDCEKSIAHLREQFPNTPIKITGCLNIANATETHSTESCANSPTPRIATLDDESAGHLISNTASSTEHYPLSRAYLKVQDGCSGKCAFCIVPSFRGKPISVPFHEVVARARKFLDAGFREIVLTGCNLCLYHSEGRGIAELAAELASLESPGHRIRLGSVEPGICDSRIIDAMESAPNICRFLHLSLQSASDRILRLMRRPYTAEQVFAFCSSASRRLGDRMAFGADIISGFPGETDSDHEATKQFLSTPLPPFDNNALQKDRECRSPFIHLHVFPYSERPGTEAATLPNSIPPETRRARAREIETIGAENRLHFASRLVGQTVTVCIEKDGNGRTDEYLRCNLRGAAARRSLALAKVEKYSVRDGSLSAIILAEHS